VFVAIEYCFIKNIIHYHTSIADDGLADWTIIAPDLVGPNPAREDVEV
jgi:hypothetical protein